MNPEGTEDRRVRGEECKEFSQNKDADGTEKERMGLFVGEGVDGIEAGGTEGGDSGASGRAYQC